MKLEKILLSLCLLCFLSGSSQDKEPFGLQFYFTGVIKKHKIDYQKSEIGSVMIFSKDTSTAVLSDKHLEIARKMMKESKDGGRIVLQILEGYKKYKTDTVTIKAGSPLEQTVENFIKNWSKIKNEMETNPDQRLLLDGHSVRIELKKNNIIYDKINVSSPSADSHPEIFQLISQMESFYKSESRNSLID